MADIPAPWPQIGPSLRWAAASTFLRIGWFWGTGRAEGLSASFPVFHRFRFRGLDRLCGLARDGAPFARAHLGDNSAAIGRWFLGPPAALGVAPCSQRSTFQP
jgi:hypothetical protein